MESIEETKLFLEKIAQNELYKKSNSLHKMYQMHQYSNPLTGAFIEGEQVRKEDKNGFVPEQEGYDKFSERIVTYNFKNGVLHSENGEPAIQYEGHWEIWNHGMLKKVVHNNIEEIWEDGVPVSIKEI